jgi:uncharacterized membrane protein
MIKSYVILALISTLCYAVCGVIGERYAQRTSVLWQIILANTGMLIIALSVIGIQRSLGKPAALDVDRTTFWMLITVWGTMSFAAAYAFYQALHEGGSLPEITTILCLLPVFSTALRHLFVQPGEEPPPLPSVQALIGSSLLLAGILVLAFQFKPPK